MPRQSRIVIPNVPHHITQRGNYRQNVFEEDSDYEQYCSWLKEYTEEYDLDILAYCLMSNHVHFIVVPCNEDSLARAFNTIHMRYSQYMNRKHNVGGHLWQGRFFSCFMDDEHVYRAIKEGEKEKGLRMGARGFIAKPFNENELKETIKSVLEEEK